MDGWWVSGLSLLALLLADHALLWRRRSSGTPLLDDPKSGQHVWLQDLILATLVYYGSLTLAGWRLRGIPVGLTALFFVFPAITCGLLAATSLSRRWTALETHGAVRAAVFAFLLAAFGASPEVSLVAWWLVSRVTAYAQGRQAEGLTARAWYLASAVLLVYAVAFFLPLCGGPKGEDFRGYDAYRFCWEGSIRSFWDDIGFREILLALPWSANPALWLGLSFLAAGRCGRAALCGGLALAFGLSIKVGTLICDAEAAGFKYVPNNPALNRPSTEIIDAANSPAYYTWLASMALLVVVALCLRRKGPIPSQ